QPICLSSLSTEDRKLNELVAAEATTSAATKQQSDDRVAEAVGLLAQLVSDDECRTAPYRR
ncbi:unnamed protein product, partial [Linum tenue]